MNAKPSLVYTTAAGTHKVSFQGRLSRHKKLKPGKYRLSLVSVDGAGNRSTAKTRALHAGRRQEALRLYLQKIR